jgi:ketosteroid isomerase-like protein
MATIEERLQKLEDQQAIYQVVCGYGYSVDGCNAQSVGERYAEDGVYAVGDMPSWVGRDAVAGITESAGHLKLVGAGCAHMSTLPFVVIEGDRAVATCHTMVPMHGENGFFIGRLSASRIELVREADGQWRITHRQNYLLDGNPEGPALLARLNQGPTRA